MKQHVFAFYNKTISAYNPPVFTPLPKEGYVDSIKRAALLGQIKAPLDELELHYLGVFDDILGTFELKPRPEMELNLSTLVAAPVIKEAKNDGQGRLDQNQSGSAC